MLIENRDWPLIYCEMCKALQPVRTDIVAPDAQNDHSSIDLSCAGCDFVIATLHATAKWTDNLH
jgi:hypothetical protein